MGLPPKSQRRERTKVVASAHRYDDGRLVMKTYQHELEHAYDHSRSGFRSSSLSHSLIMATVVGAVVAFVGIALFALSRYLQIPWHMAAAAGGIGQVVIVSVLLLVVLEQSRKRSIRQVQEFIFLNHHIRNAITQMTMASYLADLVRRETPRLCRGGSKSLTAPAVCFSIHAPRHLGGGLGVCFFVLGARRGPLGGPATRKASGSAGGYLHKQQHI